ncbi:hypothetical protein ACP4OV_028085 [Aristida adscensionis]
MEHPHIPVMVMLTSFFLLVFGMGVAAQSSNNTDLAALLAFRSQLSDPLGRVTALELPGVPLHGEITPQLGNLSFLRVLNLTSTDLVGSIPDDLGRLPRLVILDLGNNSLSGTIPSTIGNLTRLQSLALHHNQLSGGIPSDLLGLINLDYLSLKTNYLSGVIPNFSCTSTPLLTQIYIHNNSLSGYIPHGFGSLLWLRDLWLRHNQLTGPAPPSIFNMSTLETMALGGNNLIGSIPGNESFILPMLRTIDFYKTKFTGRIPVGLAACKNLQILNIPGNLFVDVIPTWLAQLPNLIGISMGLNYVFGSIPRVLSNITKLEVLDIPLCNLSGQIPEELGTLRQLTRMYLAFNHLVGPFPSFIGNLSKLAYLNLEHNQLAGPVLSTLGNFRYIQTLRISSNNFVGDLDFLGSLGNCQQLQVLTISNNPYTSAALNPNHVGNLSTRLLEVEAINSQILANSMSGPIPTQIGNLRGLVKLSLEDNKISGTIPDELSNLTMLEVIDLSYNKLSSAIPFSYLCGLNLSFNNLEGRIPSGGFLPCVEKPHPTHGRHILKITLPIVIIAFGIIMVFLYLQGRKKFVKYLDDKVSVEVADVVRHRLVSYREIVHATNNFNQDNLLGAGSFGRVFKGQLDDGMVVAIKVLTMEIAKATKRYLGDFGIAKILLGDNNSIVSASIPGTIGYMALEYAFMGRAPRKSDVFSFGIMLLEVFNGKRPTDPLFVGDLTLREWVSKAFPARLIDIADEKLLQDEETRLCFEYQTNTSSNPAGNFLVSIFELGLMCSREPPEERMAMNDVVRKLKNINKEYSATIQALQRPYPYLINHLSRKSSFSP